MRESCSCGAGISTLFYRRAQVWRQDHRHTDEEEPQPRESEVEVGSNTQVNEIQIGFQLEKQGVLE